MKQCNKKILTEGENVLDIYVKKQNGDLSTEEISNVKDRFKELVNHNNTNGTKM